MAEWKPPAWLEDVLERRRASPVRFPDEAEWPIEVEAGDIRAASAMDGEGASRLVLVTKVDDEDASWVNAMLLTEVIEAAANRDVRLEPDETGLSFKILVQTDIVGPLFVAQLRPRIGSVDPDMLDALQDVKRGDDLETLRERRGLPIRSRNESRASWKERELQAMHDLAAECFTRLVLAGEEREEILVDPDVFEAVRERGELGILLRVLDVLSERNARAEVPAEALTGQKSRLSSRLKDLGPDEWRAVQGLLEDALKATPDPGGETGVKWHPERRSDDPVLRRRILARAARGDRHVRFITRADVWRFGDRSGTRVMLAQIEDGGVVQLIPELVEDAA